MLDGVARLKHSDAIVCDITNRRISARLMRRQGWEPLPSHRWHRYYIRRFYGRYPVEAMPAAGVAQNTTRAGGAFDAAGQPETSAIAFPA